ncbi:adenosylcobinamide-phosphate synthase CbiB [Bacillus andreraoultii]|uniref:adenosylcobinamide-phosphate synthase CbiB n=1 Tax=Bacillus andreraoultii TaxID=1499685 RepID=UPI00053A2D6D|nr:adenosylcobinamide-phosphate synthase CbiB [Bacillus andreraoultii]
MIISHLIAMTLAFLIDRIVGDPPTWPHPVRWIGSLISKLEKILNKGNGRKIKGFIMVSIVLIIVFSMTLFVTFLGYYIHQWVGITIEALLISTTIAQKSLQDAALEVYRPLAQGKLEEARLKLSYIVGRDTDELEEREITRGVVETVAENTSDGVTAPLFWTMLGGAPLAFIYRVVNTCDSMVGYKNERYEEFGYPSAKLDDLLNWIPSRLTGFFMILVNPSYVWGKSQTWHFLLRDAKKHPSPNSGWCEAAVAALLGVQLGGRNTYKGVASNRALMGEATRPLHFSDILKTNRILRRTSVAFLLFLLIGGAFIEMAITWIESTLFI